MDEKVGENFKTLNVNNEKYVLDQLNYEIRISKHSSWFFDNLRKNWDKYVYTMCILLNYLHFGIDVSMMAPAMVDLRFMLRTTMVKFNYGSTIGSTGYLIGSFSGFLYKYVNRQLTLLFMTAIMGIFTILLPLSQNVYQYYLFNFISFVGAGAWDSGNSVWLIEMWNVRAPSLLQIQQMMYGVGTIIAPLLVSPYVVGDLSNKTTVEKSNASEYTTFLSVVNTTILSSNITSDDDINYSVDRRSKLRIPFMVGGILTLPAPIILLVMFFMKRYKIPEKQTQNSNEKTNNSKTVIDANPPAQPLEISSRIRMILIGLFALSLMGYNALETVFLIYASTYCQYLPIRLSATKAAQLTSILSATYTIGRGVSALISSRIRADIMLCYHIVIIGLSLVILYFGQNTEILLYIGMSTLGFGYSAMWPSYFSYAEKTIKLTDRINSIFAIASSLFIIASPFLVAPLIEKHPDVLLNLEFGFFSFVVFLFIVILIIVKRSQRYPVIYTVNN